MKLFCVVVLCAYLFCACDKDNDEYEPVKPPIEQPEEPVEPEEPDNPVTPPSIKDIINVKIGDLNMIIGSNNWNAVAYGNGKYVAVGNNGYVTTSINGATWSNPRQVGTSDWNKVKFLNNNFIAVGEGNKVMISNDGEAWNINLVDKNLSATKSWYNVIFGQNKYLISGSGGSKYYSADGVNWTEGNSSGYNLFGATYGQEKFVLCDGRNGNIQYTTNPFRTSNWEGNASVSDAGLRDCIYDVNKDLFVTVGGDGRIYTSQNLQTWTKRLDLGSGKTFVNVVIGAGRYIAVGFNGLIATSEDSVNWKVRNIEELASLSMYGVCVIPN